MENADIPELREFYDNTVNEEIKQPLKKIPHLKSIGITVSIIIVLIIIIIIIYLIIRHQRKKVDNTPSPPIDKEEDIANKQKLAKPISSDQNKQTNPPESEDNNINVNKEEIINNAITKKNEVNNVNEANYVDNNNDEDYD